MKGPRESHIERKVCDYAKSKGMLAEKLILRTGGGYPDRTFFCCKNKVFFIEFKAKGGRLSWKQKKWISKLKDLDHPVYVVDNIEDGKKIIDKHSKEYV